MTDFLVRHEEADPFVPKGKPAETGSYKDSWEAAVAASPVDHPKENRLP
jgi:hypothetical protein